LADARLDVRASPASTKTGLELCPQIPSFIRRMKL
jgi:hypothetical protein